jgi:preprotein translocase subunit SecA
MITEEIKEYLKISNIIKDVHDEVALVAGIGPRMSKKKKALLRPLTEKSKVHRNELCSCGSGKKYKKCCFIKPAQ